MLSTNVPHLLAYKWLYFDNARTWSANIIAATGPETMLVKSRTFSPSKAPISYLQKDQDSLVSWLAYTRGVRQCERDRHADCPAERPGRRSPSQCMTLGRGRQVQIGHLPNKALFQQLSYDFKVLLGVGARRVDRRFRLAINHAEVAMAPHDVQAGFI